jgi:hypothetical protein
MALLCNHVIPLDADDTNDDIRQQIGKYWDGWNQPHNNECLLVTDEGKTEIRKNSNSKINYFENGISAIRVRPGYRITLYEHDNLNINSSGEYEGTEITYPGVDDKGSDSGDNFNLHHNYFSDKTSSVYLQNLNPQKITAEKTGGGVSGGIAGVGGIFKIDYNVGVSVGVGSSSIPQSTPIPTPAPPKTDIEKMKNIYNNFIENIKNNSEKIIFLSSAIITLIVLYKFWPSKKRKK